MAVDSSLVTLGQTKPTLQIEVVLDFFELAGGDEKAREEAEHDFRHVLVNRIFRALETLGQFLELLLAFRTFHRARFEGRGYFRDVLDVFADRLLLGPDFVQSSVDAAGQTAELLFCGPPFFSSKFRWSESRTSTKASAI